ncbi:PDR/VanB family oxidoreductase [Prauserella oleivorans]|uniref:PDR/VanB family oxidoreductase n=1 Tax=Prauserella oleivorans TaxID=1478153 RepID=A0ABW5W8U4_9PSEU
MTTLRLVVASTTEIATGIREITFVRPDGGVLPSHPAGSHIVVEAGDQRNAYSLTNPGARPRRYSVAVLLRPDGNGGSRALHDLRPGAEVVVSPPRSAFPPVATARRHLLVAGGIGITPMLAHAREALRWGREAELLYVHRPEAAAFGSTVDDLLGPRAHRTTDRAEFGRLLGKLLGGAPIGTHLYVCGPTALMDHVLDTAAGLGWPAERLHSERFTPAELEPGRPFTARLARSGRDVKVGPGTSLLDALLAEGVPVPSMCRQGVCGECRVPVLSGRPSHRDEYLDDDERAAGTAVMCCVSRSETDLLEVDL